MITDQDIKESRNIIQKLIQEGLILPSDQKYVDFFLKKAEQSLQTAQSIFKMSQEPDLKESLQLPLSYEGYMWTINAAYYTMFYAGTALLAKYNHCLKIDKGVHPLTYHALVYYFLDNDKKLSKHILEQYQQAENEAAELLQAAEQEAREQIETIKFELSKRREFTYEMGKIAERNKAETSIKRAESFLMLIKELILS